MCASIQFSARIFSFVILTIVSIINPSYSHSLLDNVKEELCLNECFPAEALESSSDSLSLYATIYEAKEVNISISSKVKTIKKNFENGEATEGNITVTIDGKTYSFSSSFELGGKTRRKICRLAPVKINIKKKELKAAGFAKGMDKTKIVFQCNTNKSMVDAIKMEKIIYDLHAIVSPYARRSKMITVNIEGDDDILYALLLEDDDDFEIRTATKILKNKTVATTALNREEYIKMCLFQYMISNSDWSARKGHNTDLYRRLEDNSLICVPYDFDYSGIINNHYAMAPENLPITEVTQRYFMDKKVSLEELKLGVAAFVEKEASIFQTIDDCQYLSDGSKKRMKKFIMDFYKIIKNEKKVKRLIK